MLFGWRGTWLLAIAAASACSDQPKRDVDAVVTRIGHLSSARWHTDEVVITARTARGLIGTKTVIRSLLTCQVGDTIKAVQQGISLTLSDTACERGKPFRSFLD